MTRATSAGAAETFATVVDGLTHVSTTGAPFLVASFGADEIGIAFGGVPDATSLRAIWTLPFGISDLQGDLTHDPPRPEELTNVIGLVTDHLDDILSEQPDVATAGTVICAGHAITVVAAVEVGRFDPSGLHGAVLTRRAVEEVFRTLATEPSAHRAHNPGLPEGFLVGSVAACCALVALMRRLQLDRVLVSSTASSSDGSG